MTTTFEVIEKHVNYIILRNIYAINNVYSSLKILNLVTHINILKAGRLITLSLEN